MLINVNTICRRYWIGVDANAVINVSSVGKCLHDLLTAKTRVVKPFSPLTSTYIYPLYICIFDQFQAVFSLFSGWFLPVKEGVSTVDVNGMGATPC